MSRERRDRMAEGFVAMGDALRRSPVPVYTVEGMTPVSRLPRPAYLPAEPPQTPAEYRAALSRLGRLGIVREAVH